MKKILLTAAAFALVAGAAHAQTDGALSQTSSTGTFDVNATVVPMVRISGLDNISLTIDPATLSSNFGTTSGITQFCVFSNVDAAGTYKVRVLGDAGNAGDFSNPYGLTGTSTGTVLGHTVGYHDNAAYHSVNATFMRQSSNLTKINTKDGQARSTTTDCSGNGLGGSNSSLRVGIRNTNAIAALADTYTGTLSVVVSVP